MNRVCGKNVGKLLSRVRDMSIVNCDDQAARFAHYRINTLSDGKILVFGTGNVIRAGGCTHADSVLSVIKFALWVQMRLDVNALVHYSCIQTPNMVLTGRYSDGHTPEHMISGWRCTKTSKFPGIAITTAGRLPSFALPPLPLVTATDRELGVEMHWRYCLLSCHCCRDCLRPILFGLKRLIVAKPITIHVNKITKSLYVVAQSDIPNQI